MSIFSGWTWEKLKIAYETAKNTPEGLAAVAIIGVVMLGALLFAGMLTTRHLSGFYAKIQEEEERAKEEEEQEMRLKQEHTDNEGERQA